MTPSLAALTALALTFEPLPTPRDARTVRVRNIWDQRVPYAEALAWQRALLAERAAASRSGDAGPGDALIVLQHLPVLTLGTSSTLDNVLSADAPPFELSLIHI